MAIHVVRPKILGGLPIRVLGPHVETVLRMESIKDKAAGGPFDVFCKDLRSDWHRSEMMISYRITEQMVAIFEELDSDNGVIAYNAHQILAFLEDSGVSLLDMIVKGLPQFDFSALRQIASKGTDSKNDIVKARACVAYEELFRNYQKGVPEVAARAAPALRDLDEKIRAEGLAYFQILLVPRVPGCQHNVSEEDLLVAIDVASKLYSSNAWNGAYSFFRRLIEHGKPEDILKIKESILDACTSNRPFAFDLCHRIVATHCQREDVLSIPLQVVNNACESEDQKIRDEGFKLFGPLLYFAPNFSISSFMTAILMESKRKDPCIQFFKKLCAVVNEDFLSLGHQVGLLMKTDREKYGPSLSEALNNLSSSGHFKGSVEQMKKKLESRLGKP